MERKVFTYDSESVEVQWDQKRCIHAAACVNGLPSVFDTSRKPWIDPSKAATDEIREVIQACPSGALSYSIHGSDEEMPVPEVNTMLVAEDGPLYLSGNIRIVDKEGNTVLRDTRVALCRCGASGNKPLCDLSHDEAGFKAGTAYNPERLETEPSEIADGELLVTLLPNGPFVVTGNYELTSGDNGPQTRTQKKMSFCRCGASANKPFCDGAHRNAGFVSG